MNGTVSMMEEERDDCLLIDDGCCVMNDRWKETIDYKGWAMDDGGDDCWMLNDNWGLVRGE